MIEQIRIILIHGTELADRGFEVTPEDQYWYGVQIITHDDNYIHNLFFKTIEELKEKVSLLLNDDWSNQNQLPKETKVEKIIQNFQEEIQQYRKREDKLLEILSQRQSPYKIIEICTIITAFSLVMGLWLQTKSNSSKAQNSQPPSKKADEPKISKEIKSRFYIKNANLKAFVHVSFSHEKYYAEDDLITSIKFVRDISVLIYGTFPQELKNHILMERGVSPVIYFTPDIKNFSFPIKKYFFDKFWFAADPTSYVILTYEFVSKENGELDSAFKEKKYLGFNVDLGKPKQSVQVRWVWIHLIFNSI